MDGKTFIAQYLDGYMARDTFLSFGDGCVLKGLIDLYRATGEGAYRDLALDRLARQVTAGGSPALPETGACRADYVNCGRALLFALDETGDERYKKAADLMHDALSEAQADPCARQPRLKDLYAAEPFRAEYDVRFLKGAEARTVADRFRYARQIMFDPDSGLYTDGCGAQRPAGPERAAGPFRSDGTGWLLMALIDAADAMNEQLYEYRRAVEDLFAEAAHGVLRCRGRATGLYCRAMVLYAILKGVRLGILNAERYQKQAVRDMEKLQELWLIRDENGRLRLKDEGPAGDRSPDEGTAQDGRVAAGVFMMALAEYLRAKKETA